MQTIKTEKFLILETLAVHVHDLITFRYFRNLRRYCCPLEEIVVNM